MASVNTSPCYDPLSHLVHAAGRENVTDVWMAGERVVDSGTPTRIDTAALLRRTRDWQARLAATTR